MFNRILVPLDGSEAAESALKPALYFAHELAGSLVLVHLLEKNPPRSIHGEKHLRTPVEAQQYLELIQQKYAPHAVTIECHVHETEIKNVGKGIAAHVQEYRADSIVMCRHGKGNTYRWLWGSIAQQVLSRVPVPMLLTSGVTALHEFAVKKILLPVDAREKHPAGEAFAISMAQKLSAHLRIVLVVPTFGTLSGQWNVVGRFLPGATIGALDAEADEAEIFLNEKKAKIAQLGVPVETGIQRTAVVEGIQSEIADSRSDLVILGTHGQRGVEAILSSSVTARLCQNCAVPLLMIPQVSL